MLSICQYRQTHVFVYSTAIRARTVEIGLNPKISKEFWVVLRRGRINPAVLKTAHLVARPQLRISHVGCAPDDDELNYAYVYA